MLPFYPIYPMLFLSQATLPNFISPQALWIFFFIHPRTYTRVWACCFRVIHVNSSLATPVSAHRSHATSGIALVPTPAPQMDVHCPKLVSLPPSCTRELIWVY